MKRYIVLPTNKIAMFVFNLLPYVDYRSKHKDAKMTIFLPNTEWVPLLGKRRKIANEQLYKMCLRAFEEHGIDYTENKVLSLIYHLLFRIFPSGISKRDDFKSDHDFYTNIHTLFGIMPQYPADTRKDPSDFQAFRRDEPFVRFSKEEIAYGEGILGAHGIDPAKPMVTFHARDDQYHRHTAEIYGFRDSRFEDAVEGLRYLESCNIYSFRMGERQVEVDPKLVSDKIIDYTAKFRTDFMDIFLISRSKFFVGNTSGLWGIPYLFKNIPIVGLNFIPINYVPLTDNDLYIPKKLWISREKRFMTLREMLSVDFVTQYDTGYYSRRGIEVVDNSQEEIKDVIQEMNERIDGGLQYDEEDASMQKRVGDIFCRCLDGHRSPSRIGRAFIKQNKFLLE